MNHSLSSFFMLHFVNPSISFFSVCGLLIQTKNMQTILFLMHLKYVHTHFLWVNWLFDYEYACASIYTDIPLFIGIRSCISLVCIDTQASRVSFMPPFNNCNGHILLQRIGYSNRRAHNEWWTMGDDAMPILYPASGNKNRTKKKLMNKMWNNNNNNNLRVSANAEITKIHCNLLLKQFANAHTALCHASKSISLSVCSLTRCVACQFFFLFCPLKHSFAIQNTRTKPTKVEL